MTSRAVNLHIKKIRIEGVDGLSNRRLRQSLERELRNLIVKKDRVGEFPASGSINQVTAKPIQLTHYMDEGRLGRIIARSVFEGLDK